MFAKLSRSWELVKASAAVLRADRELLVFPVLSTLATLCVGASFLLPAYFAGLLDPGADAQAPDRDLALALISFVFYLTQYFVIIFFNSALVGAALIRLDGGDPTVGDGFRIAMSRLPAIFGYALISATVGMLIKALQERVGFIGRWIVGLMGVAWTLATFLVVPVLVARKLGPIEAVKDSASLLKKTWGENLAGNLGMGLVFFFIGLGIALVGVALMMMSAYLGSMTLAVSFGGLMILALVLMALVQAALQGIYSAALFRYADRGEAGFGFPPMLVSGAFQPKS